MSIPISDPGFEYPRPEKKGEATPIQDCAMRLRAAAMLMEEAAGWMMNGESWDPELVAEALRKEAKECRKEADLMVKQRRNKAKGGGK